MSFARAVPLKKNEPSMAIPPLPKPPIRPQSKRYVFISDAPCLSYVLIVNSSPSLLPTAIKKQETKTDDPVFSAPHQTDLKAIVK